jgi:hypothetical protein
VKKFELNNRERKKVKENVARRRNCKESARNNPKS